LSTLLTKISEFVAVHKRFPTAVDLRKADQQIWRELTPSETREFLENAYQCDPKCWAAFQYWLYWLQAVRFRVTNANLAAILESQSALLRYTSGLDISRLKYGRRSMCVIELNVLYNLYLLSSDQRHKLKQEVLNSNGTTTK
jgi:hypothetical protein